jgi:glycine cleavage system transcriptional repressor
MPTCFSSSKIRCVCPVPGRLAPCLFSLPPLHSAAKQMTTRYPNSYVLNVLADDHPGIIAAVTSAVQHLGGNIDAFSQSVLAGYFTLITVVSFADPIEPDKLAAEVRGNTNTGYQVLARKFVPPATRKPAGPVDRFVLTAFGKDKPGIVRHFSQYLAGKDINIVDLFCQRHADDFLLIGELEIPVKLDLAPLQAELEAVAAQEKFTVKLQHENIFVATNQLRLPHTLER